VHGDGRRGTRGAHVALGLLHPDALAVVVGEQLGARLPERAIKIGAAVLFFAFGALLIAAGLQRGWSVSRDGSAQAKTAVSHAKGGYADPRLREQWK